MIEIYKSSNTNYDYNGDYVLDPISCVLDMELNGAWALEMEYPIDDKFQYINENTVLSVPTPFHDKQLYRIYNVVKSDESIRAYARPIFMDAMNDCFLFDVRPTDKTGQEALNIMITNKKYKAISNIRTISTAYYVQKNLIEAISSNDENSFLNRWGGELLYDNYTLHIDNNIGQDRGVKAEFGFNLQGIEEDVNMSNVITRIIPKAYNGYILPNNETIDSPNINKYPIVYTRVIEYSDVKLKTDAQEDEVSYETLDLLYDELRKRAKAEFDKGVDMPLITYNVQMVDLSQTIEYKDYKQLLLVSLGDTVHCGHRRLNIETDARVISVTYDCILKEVKNLTLGDYQKNYFDNISNIYNTVSNVVNTNTNTLMAEKIQGILNAMDVSLKFQKTVAQKQDVRAILFEDLDPDSELYGALCIGSKGIQISNKRTADGTDWQWGTAMDAKTIYADIITAGTLQGIEIICEKGKIGGWNINSSGLYKDLLKIDNSGITNIYTWADVYIVRLIVSNIITADDDMVAHYDFDGDGRISSKDYVILKNRLKAL